MSEFDQSGIAASGLPIGGATLERPTGLAARGEVLISGAVLTALVAIPLLHMLGRWTLGRGIPGASGYEQHLTLWLTFLGGVLAARYGRIVRSCAGPQAEAGTGGADGMGDHGKHPSV
ncbi:MAG: hypothetical protein V3R29_02925, partial [Candidatus Acidoferrales bacterium]